MFKKLRNKLILINLGITTVVIFLTFSLIYISATRSAETRPPFMKQDIEWRMDREPVREETKTETGEVEIFEFEDDIVRIVRESIEREKDAAAENLLFTLIVCGLIIEAIVAMISFILAEQAIKPVREAYETQKIFIANASHEIKTPLAAISANLEAADIHDNHWISNIETETAKLTKLNNELLMMARTDLVKETKTDEVKLSNIISKTLEEFTPRMKGIKCKKELDNESTVRISATDYQQILSILLDNAIKYSDKKISIKLNNNELRITNDGAIIPAENLPHIFERFYQVDKTTEGVGLGLSIAKQIAENNHWQLRAESKNETTFILKI